MAAFEVQVIVDCNRETAIGFLKRPDNLVRISPDDMNLLFIDAPEVFEFGSRFEFQVTGFGQVQTATHQITAMDDLSFTETQVAGAMRHYVNQHSCETTDSDQTVIIERVEFEPPGGLLGLIATEERIQARMEQVFQHRHSTLQQILAGMQDRPGH
jgi:ligand-binding SRPBCC domain-containing protein